MTLGRNPFEGKEPLPEKPPVRPPVRPLVVSPIKSLDTGRVIFRRPSPEGEPIPTAPVSLVRKAEESREWLALKLKELQGIPWEQRLTEIRRQASEAGIVLPKQYLGEQPRALGPVETLERAGETVIRAVEAPLFEVAGVPISAGTIATLVAIGFGVYQGVKSLVPLFNQVKDKTLQTVLNTGLDKWIARMSRGVQPQHAKGVQNALYNVIAKNRIWLQQRATENMLSRMGRGVSAPQAATQAVTQTMTDLETRFGALVPKATQTGAMAMGGLPVVPEVTPMLVDIPTPNRLFLKESAIKAMAKGYREGNPAIMERVISVKRTESGFAIIEGHNRVVAAKEAGVEPPIVVLTEAQTEGLNAPEVDALARKVYAQRPPTVPPVVPIPGEVPVVPEVTKFEQDFIERSGQPTFYAPETKIRAKTFTQLITTQYDATIKGNVRNIHIGKVEGKTAWADGFMLEIKPVPEKLKRVRGYQERKKDLEGKPRDFGVLVPDYSVDGVEVAPILKTPLETIGGDVAFLANSAKDQGITIDAKYIEYFMANYPDAKFIMKSGSISSPINVQSKGKTVGTIMPIFKEASEIETFLRYIREGELPAKPIAPTVEPIAKPPAKVPTTAPLITPTAVPEVTGITLSPSTRFEADLFINRGGIQIGEISTIISGDGKTLIATRIELTEKGVLNRTVLQEIGNQLENTAREKGFESIGIEARKGEAPFWLRAGFQEQLPRIKGIPLMVKELAKPPAVEVTKPPVEPVTPPEPVVAPVEGVTEILASTEQKAMAHTLAKDKALINEAGKTRQQYRRLAENITGKKSMKDMTKDEASAFIEALEKYPDKKWSAKTGTWIPQPIPITKALVPENYFNIKFGEPTPIKFFTSQNFYATKLGVGELTRPLELAKQRLDLEYPAWTKAVDAKIKDLNKVYKVTIAEKLIAVRNNIPTRAVSDMAKLLNKYEDLPPDVAARLGEDKVKLFSWFRNVDRTILSGENKVRELLNMPLIPHRKAYLRHIADRTANEIMQGSYSLPQDLAYWSKQIVGKKIFNPMSVQRKLSDDLLEHFSKDLNYITKSMIWTGLKEIHLSQPLQAFTAQLNVLSKGNMPFSSLTSEELLRAQAVSTLPASTRKWLVDYVNQVIKGQQTELDASVNRIITQTGIGGVLDKLLKEFGRSIGTRPVTVMAQFAGRINILATIGTKPRQIIRNLFQTTQNLAIYGVTPTLQAELPAGKTLTRLLNNSLFLKSYARYEELPTSAMGKVEAAWMWAYGKSAIINARKGMKAAFYPTVDYITNPKNKGLGWADPQRTYTEEKGFLYPSEEENLLREMEYGAGATQYQYIAMGMPEIFRHKVLTPITRLQSWWMNYFAKFHREALHRFWTGSVGWNPNLKLPPSARLNWFKYIILGGAVLTAMGYKKSFMKDVLPHWGSPAVQFATGAYNYVIADSDYARKQAELAMSYSISAFVPGMIDYKSWKAVWTGEKPMDSLFFYGEGWEPEMPTWGIPILEEENEIKRQINYVKDEVPTFKRLLGTQIPSEDDIEEYTYEMSDFASEIRALIRDIPDDRMTELSDITQMYKRAETMWDANYYSLPSSDRQEWLQQDTPESIWTGAYLALWGKLKVTGWVSGNPQTIELIKKLVDDFNIPPEAIPSLGELKEEAKDTRKRRPIIPRTTKPTEPAEQPSSSLGVNPFE